jgi:hypothetical protein
MTEHEPRVALAFLLASPALPVAAAVGAFLGLHADGLVEATFVGPIVYRLVVAWMVRSMSSQPARDRPPRPFWRLDVLDVLLIYPAATAVGLWTSGDLFGRGFPSSWARALFAIVLTLLLSLTLEFVTTLSPRLRMAIRIGAGIVTFIGVIALVRDRA